MKTFVKGSLAVGFALVVLLLGLGLLGNKPQSHYELINLCAAVDNFVVVTSDELPGTKTLTDDFDEFCNGRYEQGYLSVSLWDSSYKVSFVGISTIAKVRTEITGSSPALYKPVSFAPPQNRNLKIYHELNFTGSLFGWIGVLTALAGIGGWWVGSRIIPEEKRETKEPRRIKRM